MDFIEGREYSLKKIYVIHDLSTDDLWIWKKEIERWERYVKADITIE